MPYSTLPPGIHHSPMSVPGNASSLSQSTKHAAAKSMRFIYLSTSARKAGTLRKPSIYLRRGCASSPELDSSMPCGHSSLPDGCRSLALSYNRATRPPPMVMTSENAHASRPSPCHSARRVRACEYSKLALVSGTKVPRCTDTSPWYLFH